VRRIGRLFAEDAPGMLARIRRAISRGDAESLRAEAHALKGSAANFVAPAAVDAAARLESMGRSADLKGAPSAACVVAREVSRLTRALAGLGVSVKRREVAKSRTTAKPKPGSKPARRRAAARAQRRKRIASDQEIGSDRVRAAEKKRQRSAAGTPRRRKKR
jgi:HPt (histidine-containing phosphotransfer) domain-containing protein